MRLQLFRRERGKSGGIGEAREQLAGDAVYLIVVGLGGKHHCHQQLENAAELQGGLSVEIGLFQYVEDMFLILFHGTILLFSRKKGNRKDVSAYNGKKGGITVGDFFRRFKCSMSRAVDHSFLNNFANIVLLVVALLLLIALMVAPNILIVLALFGLFICAILYC